MQTRQLVGRLCEWNYRNVDFLLSFPPLLFFPNSQNKKPRHNSFYDCVLGIPVGR